MPKAEILLKMEIFHKIENFKNTEVHPSVTLEAKSREIMEKWEFLSKT